MGDEFFGLERCHASGTCGSHCLAEHLVLNIASGEDAGYTGGGTIWFSDYVSLVVHGELVLEQLCRRIMADSDKQPIDRDSTRSASLNIL